MAYGYLVPTGGFTLEFWFKRDALPVTSFQTLASQRTQASVSWNLGGVHTIGRQLSIEMSPTGVLYLQFINESATAGTFVVNYVDPSPTGYGNDNTWHHIAVRLLANKTSWTLFMDGLPYASGTASAAVNWKPGLFTFGGQWAPHVGNFGSHHWDKWMAYPVMFEKPLSDNRIFEHYTAGASGTVYYGDDEVTRLSRIATWADVPDQSREFEAPLVELQGIQVAGANALSAFQDTAAAASGLVFADGQSRMVYHNRRHSYNRWNVATFAESTDSAPEIGLTFTADDANIYNDVRGERPYGSQVRLIDDTSKASFGRKTLSFSLPVTTHEELTNAVSWIISKYRDAVIRVSNITLRAESSDLIEWAATGGIQIGDHITLDELPPEAAPEVGMEFVVEKIALNVDIKGGVWELGLELSPFKLQEVFQVGVSTLGSRYRIAY